MVKVNSIVDINNIEVIIINNFDFITNSCYIINCFEVDFNYYNMVLTNLNIKDCLGTDIVNFMGNLISIIIFIDCYFNLISYFTLLFKY